jgi:hypothetical protein
MTQWLSSAHSAFGVAASTNVQARERDIAWARIRSGAEKRARRANSASDATEMPAFSRWLIPCSHDKNPRFVDMPEEIEPVRRWLLDVSCTFHRVDQFTQRPAMPAGDVSGPRRIIGQ